VSVLLFCAPIAKLRFACNQIRGRDEIEPIILGGDDAWKITTLLKEKNVR